MLGREHPTMLWLLLCPRATRGTVLRFRLHEALLIMKRLWRSPLCFNRRFKKNMHDLSCVSPVYRENTQRIILTRPHGSTATLVTN